MSRKCPANKMLSASLVSHSAVRLGSKLSSQVISSSSIVAGLILNCSISEAQRGKKKVHLKKEGFPPRSPNPELQQQSQIPTFHFLHQRQRSLTNSGLELLPQGLGQRMRTHSLPTLSVLNQTCSEGPSVQVRKGPIFFLIIKFF